MSHWDSCNAIERRPDKVSGAWIFENTRLPVATLFEVLKNSLIAHLSMRRKSQLPGATPRKPTAFKDLATVSGTTG